MEYNSGSNRASNFKIGRARSATLIWNSEHDYPWIVRHEVLLPIVSITNARNSLKEYWCKYKILITSAYSLICCIVNFSNSCFLCFLNQYSAKQENVVFGRSLSFIFVFELKLGNQLTQDFFLDFDWLAWAK